MLARSPISSIHHLNHKHDDVDDDEQGLEYGRRIPATLQSVIVSANRGREIKKPPPETMACKVYSRRWFGLRREIKFDLSDSSPTLSSSPLRSSLSSPRKQTMANKLLASSVRNQLPQVPSIDNASDIFVPKPVAPQPYLETVLQSRGYSTIAIKATECAYYNKVTQLQEASYGSFLVETIRSNNAATLRGLLEVGLSPNASNVHNESIVHLACRMGFVDILKTLMDFECRLQISDDSGRTPLHEACWSTTPCFELVEMILDVDWKMLLVADARGRLPLHYVREDNWSAFTRFFMKRKDNLWPDKFLGGTNNNNNDNDSLFVKEKPNSRHLRLPKKQISIQMARLVAQGKMSPAEVQFLTKGVDAKTTLVSEEEEDLLLNGEDSADFANDDDEKGEEKENNDEDDEDEDESSCVSFDEQEMADLLENIGSIGPVDWS